MLLDKGVCYDQSVLLTKLCYPLPCFTLYSKAKLVCYSGYLLTSYFCIPIPYDERDNFFFFFFGVQMVTVAMKLKDACSLEEKL